MGVHVSNYECAMLCKIMGVRYSTSHAVHTQDAGSAVAFSPMDYECVLCKHSIVFQSS